jgi:hypothetical protein
MNRAVVFKGYSNDEEIWIDPSKVIALRDNGSDLTGKLTTLIILEHTGVVMHVWGSCEEVFKKLNFNHEVVYHRDDDSVGIRPRIRETPAFTGDK